MDSDLDGLMDGDEMLPFVPDEEPKPDEEPEPASEPYPGPLDPKDPNA